MSAYTPGPWEVEISEDGTNHNIIPVASNGYGWVNGRYMRVGGCIDIHDARLIAAAPDLLAALQAFPGFTDDATVGDKWIEMVERAIEAATNTAAVVPRKTTGDNE